MTYFLKICTLIFISATLFPINGFCQIKIKGQVVDKESLTPIPDVSVHILPGEDGVLTDTLGVFSTNILSSTYKLYFTAIGYKDTLVDVEYFKNYKLLPLSPRIYTIPELLVFSKKLKTIKVGTPFFTDYNGAHHSKLGTSYTSYFPNFNVKKGYIETFSLRIPSNTRWDCPFKIRIMGVDSTFQTLGIPLLAKDIEVKAKGSGWFTIDLSSYKISLPKNGFIVSVIIFDAGAEYYYQTDKKANIANYGIGISMTTRPHDALPWGYIWNEKRFGIRFSFKRKYYYAVRATLKVIE